jgi:endonuclease-3
VVVDTHLQRISQRLGWTKRATPEHIEQDLVRLFPRPDWPLLSHVLIFHGRRICTARSPQCAGCPVAERCPSAFAAERIGRKPPRTRGQAEPVASKKKTTKKRARPASGARATAPAKTRKKGLPAARAR